jgi:hypothetical protein
MVLLLRTIVLLAFATPALAALEQGTNDEDRLIGTSGADTLRVWAARITSSVAQARTS